MSPWEIYLALALGPSECFMVLRPKGDNSDVGTEALLVRWTQSAGFSASYIDRGIVAAAALPGSKQVVTCTALGRVFALDAEATEQARIDTSKNGPNRHGFIMGMRAVGNSILAFGMGRQVYKRNAGEEGWSRMDEGVLDTSNSVEAATGILSLDGADADSVLAAGFNGELWRYRSGRWDALDSPTNLSLHSVSRRGATRYLVCGQVGTLLQVQDETIDVFPQSELTGDLQQIATFQNSIFVATDDGVFRCLDGETLDAWGPACPDSDKYFGISAAASSIWLYGSNRVAYSTDAATWTDLDLQPLWTLIT